MKDDLTLTLGRLKSLEKWVDELVECTEGLGNRKDNKYFHCLAPGGC